MQFKKLFLLLFVSVISFTTKAQEIKPFPVEGIFGIQYQDYDQSKVFNRILIDEHTVTLKLNEVPFKFYKVLKADEVGYHVEQYFPDREIQPVEKDKFIINLQYVTENDLIVKIIYSNHSEVLELLRVD